MRWDAQRLCNFLNSGFLDFQHWNRNLGLTPTEDFQHCFAQCWQYLIVLAACQCESSVRFECTGVSLHQVVPSLAQRLFDSTLRFASSAAQPLRMQILRCMWQLQLQYLFDQMFALFFSYWSKVIQAPQYPTVAMLELSS